MEPTSLSVEKRRALTATMFLVSMSLVLFELLLTRLFGVVLFSTFAHLALMLALLGIGIGAVIQHVFPNFVDAEKLERRLGQLCIAMSIGMLVAVLAVSLLPLTEQATGAVTDFSRRGSRSADLVNPGMFLVMLSALVIPFTLAGWIFAAAFSLRKSIIGTLYGADLIGGGFAAVLFIPLLALLAGPDVGFVCTLVPLIAAFLLFRSAGATPMSRVALAAIAIFGALSVVGLFTEVIQIRFAAGYAEKDVSYVEWTPLTRLAVHNDGKQTKVLLDNSSASEVMLSAEDTRRKAKDLDRSTIYATSNAPARVAVLAASAGPEVAIAQSYGFTNVHAIDIAEEIADLVARRFADSPVNPYLKGDTVRVKADGRAAILHAQAPFDIIQMVHANLHSNAGLLSNAWSPSLLETQEAFKTYFDNLTPDGTVSFARGGNTPNIIRSAVAALRELGVENPLANIVYVRTDYTRFMLAKKRAWTKPEVDRVLAYLDENGANNRRGYDPISKNNLKYAQQVFLKGAVMTDDRPYLDTPGLLTQAVEDYFSDGKKKPAYLVRVYKILVLQIFFALLAGLLFLFLPLFFRSRAGLSDIKGVPIALAYVACLGYGYLAVETVLIHELVLFVGHPTYAVTVVILAMLASSGAGSFYATRIAPERRQRALLIVLAAVLVLSVVQGFVVPPFLKSAALGLPVYLRILLTGATILPLGFVMGMPFSLAMSLLPEDTAPVVPWAWALNGWMSVVASLVTVLIARNFGYSRAYFLALAAYGIALVLTLVLHKVRRRG